MIANSTMLAFVIVAAVAIVLQTGILFALYRATRESTAKIEAIAGRLEQQAAPVLTTAQAILEDAQPKIAEITSNLAESTATVRANVAQMAETTAEIVDRARFQAARLDELVTTTVDRIELATDVVHHGVIGPVRRVQAIVQAVSAGIGFLRANRARKKAISNNGGPDEDMFI
jgi:methyl-accepting chemotaxis protein